jgi:hypothetical protein
VVDRQRQLCLELARAQQTQPILGAAKNAGFHEVGRRHVLARLQLALVDCLLQRAEADLVIVFAAPLVEAALGQTAMQWHLAAFEAADGNAGTGCLALAAAAALLADTRADTTADADAEFSRAFDIFEFIQPHGPCSW